MVGKKEELSGGRAANYSHLFAQFVETPDNLRVYLGDNLCYRSGEPGLKPLLSYIREFAPCPAGTVVFDRLVGNAAALLLEKAACREVYGQVGSDLAIATLRGLGIAHSFLKVVPFISDRAGDGMCPFEKASIGKSTEEFYAFACERFGEGKKS